MNYKMRELANDVFIFCDKEKSGIHFYDRRTKEEEIKNLGIFKTDKYSISKVQWDNKTNKANTIQKCLYKDGENTVTTIMLSEEEFVNFVKHLSESAKESMEKERDFIIIDLREKVLPILKSADVVYIFSDKEESGISFIPQKSKNDVSNVQGKYVTSHEFIKEDVKWDEAINSENTETIFINEADTYKVITFMVTEEEFWQIADKIDENKGEVFLDLKEKMQAIDTIRKKVTQDEISKWGRDTKYLYHKQRVSKVSSIISSKEIAKLDKKSNLLESQIETCKRQFEKKIDEKDTKKTEKSTSDDLKQ